MDVKLEKRQLRALMKQKRGVETDRAAKSCEISNRLMELPEFQAAASCLFYLSTPEEVDASPALTQSLVSGWKTVVPYCVEGDNIRLFVLRDMAELEPGAYGILEPKSSLRSLPERNCTADALELIIIPGVAFDRRGARLGRGRGCYDRLLRVVGLKVCIVALAFGCQIIQHVPTEDTDAFVDKIITEQWTYDCRSFRGGVKP